MATSKAAVKRVAENLKQVKVAVNPDISAAFKPACGAWGVPMAIELLELICVAPWRHKNQVGFMPSETAWQPDKLRQNIAD